MRTLFAFNWSKRRDHRTLDGMTIGILGMGEIGAVLAERLVPWEVTLLYARRRRLPSDVEHELRIGYRDNEALLAESDAVVCLLPYTDQTIGYLDQSRLAVMKQGAYLVSAGSGGVIDETALADLIASGHLAGAALDTFAVEPIEAHNPLVGLARAGRQCHPDTPCRRRRAGGSLGGLPVDVHGNRGSPARRHPIGPNRLEVRPNTGKPARNTPPLRTPNGPWPGAPPTPYNDGYCAGAVGGGGRANFDKFLKNRRF